MIRFLLALLAIALLLVAAGEASAHGGDVVFVRDQFGNVRAVRVGNHHHRGNANFFNQNGGRNRLGFRR